MAKKVSDDIFEVFGWKRHLHKDLNFACCITEHKKKTHPADVVFSYQSPVEANRIFINTDLKSYAATTIKSTEVRDAINSLNLSVACANRSAEWRERYVGDVTNYDVHGLLFVYNHDAGFDKNWQKLLADAKITGSKINARNRLYVLGPTDILYLVSVADDIRRQRGSEVLPKAAECNFFYPDMINTRVNHSLNKAATLEILTAPWQVLRYEKGGKDQNVSGSYVYYRGLGETPDEFKFLIDYLFRFQLVGDDKQISIRMPFAVGDASARFESAKDEYWKAHHSLPEFNKRMERIKFETVARVRDQFDETVLGMEE
ncbi:MAG: hypothetical protein K8R23_04980 [Chthoniobacter sp.]|nr:hypothetical protein [Chthoniobacter sp.]